MNLKKLSRTSTSRYGLLLIGIIYGHVGYAAGPLQPITTQPTPNPPTSVLVCPDTCAKNIANSKEYKTNFGPMPVGQYQVNGLVPGKYEAGVKGFGMKFYTVDKTGVLNGQLGAASNPLKPAIGQNEPSTDRKFMGSNGVVFDSPKKCMETAPPCGVMMQ